MLATDTTLVKYSDNTAESHSCKPQEALCAYTRDITVNSSILRSCLFGGIKVLGLSDATNAHAETNTQTNYNNYNICMKSDIFISNICNYSSPGTACNAGYNCIFALSDLTNAHLSTCTGNIFGANQINFCCKSVLPTCPTLNISTNKTAYDAQVNENIDFTYSCQGTDSSYEVNILATPENLNFELNGGNACTSSQKVFSIKASDSRLNMSPTTTSKTFTAILSTKDNLCQSDTISFIDYNSSLYGTSNPPTGYELECNISKIKADKAYSGAKVSIHYSCAFDNLAMKLYIFDPLGNLIHEDDTQRCGTVEGTFTNYSIPSGLNGIYLARLEVGSCTKDNSFLVAKANPNNTPIPDSNITLVIIVAISAVFIITTKKKN